ncbi:MAG: CPBP family intramembrane glutamic endopeptidase [Anaerolineales bacterium]
MENPTIEYQQGQNHQKITWLLLSLLLFFRIPFIILVTYYQPIENQNGGAVYEVSTYFLITLFIWWERKRLTEFHIDFSALILILLFRPLQIFTLYYWKVESPLTFPNFPSLLLWGISIGLGVTLLYSGFKSTRIPTIWVWLCLGFLIGTCVSVFENFSSFINMATYSGNSSFTALLSNGMNLFYHLGSAPVNEEPLFRGFLWGTLRQAKWKDGQILIIQTVLFTSAHIYFANQCPLMFWSLIPLSAILFGVLAVRSKSISTAMLAHGMINGSAYVFIASILAAYH